jgi:Legume lectin domain
MPSPMLTRTFIGAAAMGAAALLLSRAADAGTRETYPNFTDTKGLTLSGNAEATKTTDGTVLRLTPASSTDDGSFFASQTIDTSKFSTAFVFRISDPGGLADPNGHVGGDGITFAIQPISASLGGTGNGLGIGGVTPSVAVEFDTWDDTCADYPSVCDPSSNHIGVDINGVVHSVKTANVTPAMDNGDKWYGWIDYDGTTLEVRVGESDVRPEAPNLSYAIDIPMILGVTKPLAKAYVGFTASTGFAIQNQDILSWTYVDAFVDGGVAAVDSGAPVMEAGTQRDAGDAGHESHDSAVPADATKPPSPDAGSPTPEVSGCGCRMGGSAPVSGSSALASLLVFTFCARRRRRMDPWRTE